MINSTSDRFVIVESIMAIANPLSVCKCSTGVLFQAARQFRQKLAANDVVINVLESLAKPSFTMKISPLLCNVLASILHSRLLVML